MQIEKKQTKNNLILDVNDPNFCDHTVQNVTDNAPVVLRRCVVEDSQHAAWTN